MRFKSFVRDSVKQTFGDQAVKHQNNALLLHSEVAIFHDFKTLNQKFKILCRTKNPEVQKGVKEVQGGVEEVQGGVKEVQGGVEAV